MPPLIRYWFPSDEERPEPPPPTPEEDADHWWAAARLTGVAAAVVAVTFVPAPWGVGSEEAVPPAFEDQPWTPRPGPAAPPAPAFFIQQESWVTDIIEPFPLNVDEEIVWPPALPPVVPQSVPDPWAWDPAELQTPAAPVLADEQEQWPLVLVPARQPSRAVSADEDFAPPALAEEQDWAPPRPAVWPMVRPIGFLPDFADDLPIVVGPGPGAVRPKFVQGERDGHVQGRRGRHVQADRKVN